MTKLKPTAKPLPPADDRTDAVWGDLFRAFMGEPDHPPAVTAPPEPAAEAKPKRAGRMRQPR